MNTWHTTWEVARWEFRRFLKPKQLLISMVTMLVTGAASLGIARVINRGGVNVAQVALIGGDRIGLGNDTVGKRIALEPRPLGAEAAVRDSARRGDLDGLLVVHDAARAELIVRRRKPARTCRASETLIAGDAGRFGLLSPAIGISRVRSG